LRPIDYETAVARLNEHGVSGLANANGLSEEENRFLLEPIQEVGIHGQGVDLVKRRSMRRIIARRMKAATVVA
jgi:hypothetical protein